jgi:hypothetical protein
MLVAAMPVAQNSAQSAAGPPVDIGRRRDLIRILQPGADFSLGPFRVGQDGRVAPADPDAMIVFDFQWRDRPVQVDLEKDLVRVRVTLGRVPSTTGGAALREGAFATLDDLPATLPQPWTLRLLADHRVQIDWSTRLGLPMSVAGLVGSLTSFLLTLAPYLDLLEEAGVTLAPGAGDAVGMSSAWPG